MTEPPTPQRASSRGAATSGPITLRTTPSSGGHRRSRSRSRSFFTGRGDADEDAADGLRTVRVNNFVANAEKGYLSNELRTAKYTPLDMIPKSLFDQFKRVSNFYFLIIAAVSFIPKISPTLPMAQALPLIVVVGFGFARDIYEDLKRANSDRRQNGKPEIIVSRDNPSLPPAVQISGASKAIQRRARSAPLSQPLRDSLYSKGLNPDDHIAVASRSISVGDVVLVRKGEVFPCDMVLALSSGEGGVAYVSTANLDGESNLKRVVVAEAAAGFMTVDDLRSSNSVIRTQQPSQILHEFEGKMTSMLSDFTPLDASNLLLRGSILRNTEYIYGVAVYTGYDTKVAQNMRHPPSKMGAIERKLNWVVFLMFGVLACIIIVASGVSGYVQGQFGPGQWYMGSLATESNGVKTGFTGLGTFLILFGTFIPVSLFVTLEFVRLVQGLFITADPRMITGKQNAVARSTNLNETLGTIEHVLSDKTGTLTENIMRYVACSAGGEIYDTLKKKSVMKHAVEDNVEPVKELITAMALCHSVVPEPRSDPEPDQALAAQSDSGYKKKFLRRRHKGKGDSDELGGQANVPEKVSPVTESEDDEDFPDYQGQSPDEVALVTSARDYGVALLKRTLNSLIINRFGDVGTYSILAELEFNSDRKRMSMIFDCPDGNIRMFTKGADTIMLELLKDGSDLALIQEHIDHFAVEGLRTLVFAQKVIPKAGFDSWYIDFLDARNSLTDREKQVAEVSARLEQDLEYIAVTAVEDKLQDQVPETIKFLREADVRLWVLTGDKRETAENIGYSANLLDRKMRVVHIAAKNERECHESLDSALQDHVEGDGDGGLMRRSISNVSANLASLVTGGKRKSYTSSKDLGIIIDGASLKFALEKHADLFMELADYAKTVICCRVTPLQKALVVRMVRETRQKMTLAIGDGGNDVSMIQEAHVGVGIFGKEGTQAARSADYAIGEFKHLRQLVAVHGRFSHLRTAGVINLSFYKNVLFTSTQVLFQIFCFATGTTFNNQWVTNAFNVLVTSASPFLYGIFERDLDETTLFRFPAAYASARDKKLFSIRSVVEYAFVYGVWHALAVFFGVYAAFGYLKINYTSGLDSGFHLVGLVASTTTVFIALFKFFLETYIQNWVVIIAIPLSLLLYFLIIQLSPVVVQDYTLEGMMGMMFSAPNFYFTIFMIFVAAYFVDFAVLMVRRLVVPDVVYGLQRWEQMQRREGHRKDHKEDSVA